MSLRLQAASLAVVSTLVAGASCGTVLGIHDVARDQESAGGGGSGGGPGSEGGGGAAPCEAGQPVACYDGDPANRGVGLCKDGTRPCEDPGAACVGQVGPAAEDCAAKGDEDCDGAACGDTTWASGFGDLEPQRIVDIAADPQGNVVVLGQFKGTMTFGETTLTANTESGFASDDGYLAKLSPEGAPLWAKSYPRPMAFGLDVAPNGDVGVGMYVSSGNVIEGATTADGLLFFSLAPDGTPRWVNPCGGGPGYETIRRGDVSFAPDGSLLFLEVIQGNGCLVGGMSGTVIGGFDTAGGLAWSSQIDASVYGRVAGIAASTPTKAFVMAHRSGAGATLGALLYAQRNYPELTLADFGGYVRWPLASDGFGGVVMVGDFSGTITVQGQPRAAATTRDLFVARFSADGVLTWFTTFPADDAEVTGLGVAGNGIFVAGTFSGTKQLGEVTLVSKGLSDIWLSRLSLGSDPTGPSGGTLQWARSYGGFDADTNAKVAATKDAVYLAAEFRANADFGGQVLTSTGDSDVAIVRIDP